jgi:hypothetical protein
MEYIVRLVMTQTSVMREELSLQPAAATPCNQCGKYDSVLPEEQPKHCVLCSLEQFLMAQTKDNSVAAGSSQEQYYKNAWARVISYGATAITTLFVLAAVCMNVIPGAWQTVTHGLHLTALALLVGAWIHHKRTKPRLGWIVNRFLREQCRCYFFRVVTPKVLYADHLSFPEESSQLGLFLKRWGDNAKPESIFANAKEFSTRSPLRHVSEDLNQALVKMRNSDQWFDRLDNRVFAEYYLERRVREQLKQMRVLRQKAEDRGEVYHHIAIWTLGTGWVLALTVGVVSVLEMLHLVQPTPSTMVFSIVVSVLALALMVLGGATRAIRRFLVVDRNIERYGAAIARLDWVEDLLSKLLDPERDAERIAASEIMQCVLYTEMACSEELQGWVRAVSNLEFLD